MREGWMRFTQDFGYGYDTQGEGCHKELEGGLWDASVRWVVQACEYSRDFFFPIQSKTEISRIAF